MIGRALQAGIDVMDAVGRGPGEPVLQPPASTEVHPDPVTQRHGTPPDLLQRLVARVATTVLDSASLRTSITAFFPAFNDEATIARVVRDTVAVLPTLADDWEVLVVDDGSTDGTPAILDDLVREQSRLRVIRHPGNRGYGAALATGFGQARKDLVFYTDGDAQYDVRELTRLTPLMTAGVAVVNGYKLRRADALHRVVIGAIYRHVARVLFRLPIRDVDCDFRLLRRDAIQRIRLDSSSGAVCAEMIYKLRRDGCRFAEVAVHHYPRPHGRSQFFTWRRVIRSAVDVFTLWATLVLLRRPTGGPRRVGPQRARPALD
jgi:glycosyltransferase involved in cell wall biosynthesis